MALLGAFTGTPETQVAGGLLLPGLITESDHARVHPFGLLTEIKYMEDWSTFELGPTPRRTPAHTGTRGVKSGTLR